MDKKFEEEVLDCFKNSSTEEQYLKCMKEDNNVKEGTKGLITRIKNWIKKL